MASDKETIELYQLIHKIKKNPQSFLLTNILMKSNEYSFNYQFMPITCQISGKFLILPVRSRDCTSLNCVFNLDEPFTKFLLKPNATCPSCFSNLSIEKLGICTQTEAILQYAFSQNTDSISNNICIDVQLFSKQGHQSPEKYVMFKNKEEKSPKSPVSPVIEPIMKRSSTLEEDAVSSLGVSFQEQIESISKSTAIPAFTIVKQQSLPSNYSSQNVDMLKSGDFTPVRPNKWLTRDLKNQDSGTKNKWEERKSSPSPEILRHSMSVSEPKKIKDINFVKMVRSINTCRANYLKVKTRDYYNTYARWKILHFFQENTKNLFVFDLDKLLALDTPNSLLTFEKYELGIKNNIPQTHCSISDPYGEIYLIGGFDMETASQTDEILVFHDKNSTLINKGKLIVPRSGHCCCIVKDDIYIIGGFSDNQPTSSCEKFNFISGISEAIADLNNPTTFATVVNYSNKFLFKFGGRMSQGKIDENFERYNLSTGNWENLYVAPNLRKIYKACCLSGGVQLSGSELFIFGGAYDHFGDKTSTAFTIGLSEDEKEIAKITNIEKISMPIADRFENNNQVIIYDNHIFCLQDVKRGRGEMRDSFYMKKMLIHDGDTWVLSF